jgi:hypothetical protein
MKAPFGLELGQLLQLIIHHHIETSNVVWDKRWFKQQKMDVKNVINRLNRFEPIIYGFMGCFDRN